MTDTDPMPSALAISIYWGEHQKSLPEGIHISYAADEPYCFACGWWNATSTAYEKPFHGLERAHVIPRARGGSCEPSNLVLLCEPCHQSAPDTLDAEYFWRWCAAPA